MAAVISFDPILFRAQIPAYADPVAYPDATIQGYWDAGACYISTDNYGWLSGGCRARALNLMAAHLIALAGMIAAGQTPGLITSSGVDKVSVGLTPPPLRSQWGWWMSLTPYGAQLWALLQTRAVGGLYVGGAIEIGGLRRGGGLIG